LVAAGNPSRFVTMYVDSALWLTFRTCQYIFYCDSSKRHNV
jgi:hypothetical protein